MARNRAGGGVRAPYTFAKLKRDLLAAHGPPPKKSLRELAQRFGVSHGVIQRVLLGLEPQSPRIRAALNLSALAPAPVCAKCGRVHVAKRCTAGPKVRRRRRSWKKAMTILAMAWIARWR